MALLTTIYASKKDIILPKSGVVPRFIQLGVQFCPNLAKDYDIAYE